MSQWLASTLIATSLLALLVLLLRAPVARLFGARAAYALWLAPLLRMLLPPLPENHALPSVGVDAAALPAMSIVTSAAPAEPGSTGLLLTLWLAGAVLFLAWHVLAHRRFVGTALRSGRRLPTNDAAGPELVESESVPGPLATGLFRPRILLPARFHETFPAEQRDLALAHEQLHHRRGDLFALAASLVVLALHWFNPIAHIAHRAFRRDLEAACDAELVERLGAAKRETYARAIVSCAAGRLPEAICTLTTIDDLKRRVTMLNFNHGRAARLAGLGCAALLTASGLALTPSVSAQTPEPVTETKEIKRIVRMHGDRRDGVRGPGEMRAHTEKCTGEKFEASAEGGTAEKKQRTKIVLRGEKGKSNAELATMLEKAVTRIEGESEMPAEAKAQVVAQLRSKIAELRAR